MDLPGLLTGFRSEAIQARYFCNDSAGQAPVVCLTEWIAPGNAPAFQEQPALV